MADHELAQCKGVCEDELVYPLRALISGHDLVRWARTCSCKGVCNSGGSKAHTSSQPGDGPPSGK